MNQRGWFDCFLEEEEKDETVVSRVFNYVDIIRVSEGYAGFSNLKFLDPVAEDSTDRRLS